MHRLASGWATSPAPRERKWQSAFLRWSTHACRQLLDRGREQATRGQSILNNENGRATASQHTRIAARRRYFSNQKINTRNRRFRWYRPSTETVFIKIGGLRATFFATPTAASRTRGCLFSGTVLACRPSCGPVAREERAFAITSANCTMRLRPNLRLAKNSELLRTQHQVV